MFCSICLRETHPFYDGNGRTSKIQSANDKIMNFIDETEIIKMMKSKKS